MKNTKWYSQIVATVLSAIGSFFFIGLGARVLIKDANFMGGLVCILFGLFMLIWAGIVTVQKRKEIFR